MVAGASATLHSFDCMIITENDATAALMRSDSRCACESGMNRACWGGTFQLLETCTT